MKNTDKIQLLAKILYKMQYESIISNDEYETLKAISRGEQ